MTTYVPLDASGSLELRSPRDDFPGIQTLPQWILNNFSRPNVLPYVTIAATIVLVVSLPLAWIAQRLADSHLD